MQDSFTEQMLKKEIAEKKKIGVKCCLENVRFLKRSLTDVG